jgi:urease accessory protein
MVEKRLHLFQLVSPALPVGGFSYSEGLEWLVQHGRLHDAPSVRSWLEAELGRGSLTVEAATLPGLMVLLERARSADGLEARAALKSVVERDGWLLAQREAAEVRAQQRQMGGSLCELLANLGWPLPAGASPLAWPAAWAWAGVCLQLDPRELVEAFLYSWVAGQLSAAVRLVPLGPTQAQGLQLALAPLVARRAQELSGADPARLWTGGVGAGLAQLGHAELYSRLFRS